MLRFNHNACSWEFLNNDRNEWHRCGPVQARRLFDAGFRFMFGIRVGFND